MCAHPLPRDWNTPPAPAAAPPLPVIPIGFIHEGVVLRYFSPITTVGTPQSAAAQELRMECMFPADDATDTRGTGSCSTRTRRRADDAQEALMKSMNARSAGGTRRRPG